MNKIKTVILCILLSFKLLNAHATSEIISYGRLYSAEMHIENPKSILELQSIVRKANREGKKICVLGAGMSQGKQYLLSDAILVNMQNLNSMKLEEKTLTVQAGALWSNVHEYINSYGLALQVMQGSNIFSVGGSLSVNCHGWDFHKGSIINTVESITIVDANGDLLDITPNNPLFPYVIGGYGCFGIIAEAKIELTKNVPIQEISEQVEVMDYVNYFHSQVLDHKDILMHRYRLSVHQKNFFEYGITTNYKQLSDTAIVSELSLDKPIEKSIKAGLWIARNISFLKPTLWNIAESKMLESNPIKLRAILNVEQGVMRSSKREPISRTFSFDVPLTRIKFSSLIKEKETREKNAQIPRIKFI